MLNSASKLALSRSRLAAPLGVAFGSLSRLSHEVPRCVVTATEVVWLGRSRMHFAL